MLIVGMWLIGWAIGFLCGFYYGEWYGRTGAKVGTPSASHNSAMDAIVALYGRWSVTVAKNFDHTQVDDFVDWVQQQHQ